MLTPSRISILKRTLLLCIALGVMAVGVALSIKADLGTSPISSVPYVVSLMSEMSVGTATILINAILLVGEILIMRRQFQ
ncbi:MAG TPA: YitT family protein, partial [Methanocorpusculum sp.]|nr:YitT family protein [Methanocorpusculum sp.]